MKKNVLVLVLLMSIASFVVAGCGGGGGGGGVLPPAQPLAAGTFVKTPADGNLGSGGLFEDFPPYARWQSLYTADTISASGRLTGIAVKYEVPLASAVTCTGVTIKVGHTSLTALTNTFSNNVATGQGSQTTVLSNAAIVFPAAAGDAWQTIPFTTPFNYNGKDNLVVEVERPHACNLGGATFKLWTTSGTSNVYLYSFVDSSATGTQSTVFDSTRLVFSGGDDLVKSGGMTPSSAPFGQTDRMQTVYLASEISGTGPITGLAFQADATTVAERVTFTLKMAHTTRSGLTTTADYANNYGEAPVTIVSNGTFTIPANVPAGEYIWIPFPGTFTYNGRDNLIVDLDVPSISALNRMRSVATSTTRSAVGLAGEVAPSYLAASALNTKFRFNGGTMDVNPIALSAGDGFPFLSSAGARQWLFLASELGTSGKIDGIACRNWGALTSEQTYTNYRIVMSGTTAAALVADRATNLPAPVTVLQGTFVKPAGLRQGDYFTIPLTRSFPYNGTDNLVIDISGTGPTDLFGCWISQDLSYTGRRSYSSDPSATTMSLVEGLPVMRFNISK